MILMAMAFTASKVTVALGNPLAPAMRGQMQCHQPDDKRRTCRSIATYTRDSIGSYSNKAIVLISSAGPVTLETVTPVTVEAGAVCGSIRAEDIMQGKLRVADRLLSDEEAKPVLLRVSQSMTPVMGKRICTSYVTAQTGVIAKASIDGVYRAESDQTVKWVQPADGYVVAP
jgi:hypothetical protein